MRALYESYLDRLKQTATGAGAQSSNARIVVDAPIPLNLTVFRLDELPRCWFLSVRSEEGFAELAQLIDRHEGQLQHGLVVPDDVVAAISVAMRWILATWRRIDELGPDVA